MRTYMDVLITNRLSIFCFIKKK